MCEVKDFHSHSVIVVFRGKVAELTGRIEQIYEHVMAVYCMIVMYRTKRLTVYLIFDSCISDAVVY